MATMDQLLFKILCISQCVQWHCDLGPCRLWPWTAVGSCGHGWLMDLRYFPWGRKIKGSKAGNFCPKQTFLKPGVLSSRKMLYMNLQEQFGVPHPGLEESPLTSPAKGQQLPFVRNGNITQVLSQFLRRSNRLFWRLHVWKLPETVVEVRAPPCPDYSPQILVLSSSIWAWSRL